MMGDSKLTECTVALVDGLVTASSALDGREELSPDDLQVDTFELMFLLLHVLQLQTLKGAICPSLCRDAAG